MSVEILIKKIILDGGGVRFDLIGKSLPENFLGMAADLKFSGEGVKYEKMEWGNAFAGFRPEELPVKMVKNDWETGSKEGEIVFGISLKSDNLKNLRDGVIGSFYFSGKGSSDMRFVGFQHEVLSSYENGRVDVEGVKWIDAGQIKMPTEAVFSDSLKSIEIVKTPAVLEISKNPIVNMQKELPVLEDMAQSNIIPMLEMDLMKPEMMQKNESINSYNDQFFWWVGPGLIGLVLLLLISFFYLRRKVGNEALQHSRT